MGDLGDQIQGTLNDHLAEDGGGIVTAYHVIAEYIDDDGEHGWLYVTPEDQRQCTTMGLIDWAHGVATYEQQRYLDQIAED